MKTSHPFSNNPAETVASLGEERLIACIRRWLGPVSPPAPLGIGDDCAVLPPPPASHAQALTVDPVIYGRHFDDTVPPRAAGAKLLKRNLSDLAAMGAAPIAAVLALTLDPRVRITWLEQFYRGLAATARAHRVRIVGGDIAQSASAADTAPESSTGFQPVGRAKPPAEPPSVRSAGFQPASVLQPFSPSALSFAASLTLLGRATTKRMLLRTGARAGDHIYVTGALGGSILGKHYRFTPRLAEGAWLAARPEVCSMIDLSDGLAKDIHALTPPNTRAELAASAIPISPAARRLAIVAQTAKSAGLSGTGDSPVGSGGMADSAMPSEHGRVARATQSVPIHNRKSKIDNPTPLARALSDGEDYELLFAVAARADPAAFEKRWRARFCKTPLTRIGRFVPLRAPLAPGSIDLAAYRGYEHLGPPSAGNSKSQNPYRAKRQILQSQKNPKSQ